MNVIQFGSGACEKVRRYLDSYLDNELLVETNLEVSRHLEGCPDCAEDLRIRALLKRRLREAGRRFVAPKALELKVQGAVREYAGGQRTAQVRRFWMMTAAAIFLLGFGTWNILRVNSPQRLETAKVLELGLDDHMHCAVPRDYSGTPASTDRMESALGPNFADLLPVVRRDIPSEYRLELAHQCKTDHRDFVHMVFHSGGELASVILTRRHSGEALPAGMQELERNRMTTDGMEVKDYFVFVVSNLQPDRNRSLAKAVLPHVARYIDDHSAVALLE